MINQLVTIILVLIAALILKHLMLKRAVVYEFQRGMKYVNGRFVGILQPGRHWMWRHSTQVRLVDIRPAIASVPGQEILTSDGMPVRVSLAAQYEVTDLNVAINRIQNYYDAFYLALQRAARDVISSASMDELLEKRTELGAKVQEIASSQVAEFGLRLTAVSIKDIMLPGELKKIFTQVAKARQEGLAALEKARGETAALRSLANAAKLVESSPGLMQLRTLQSMSDGSGNTFVVGLPSGATPVPVRARDNGEQRQGGEETETGE